MSKKSRSRRAHICVVEDDADLREALSDILQLANMKVTVAESAERAIEILKTQNTFDLILSDVNMGAMSGHDLLKYVKSNFAHIPVLLITAYASVSESVKAIKEGAVDYLVKPFESDTLIETISRFVGGEIKQIDEPIAVDQCSRQLLALAKRVAQSDSTALLLGESGTGKEVLARYIHDNSSRSDGPFIAINCAAIPENMLESILFGYEKGAFTGAYNSTAGKFEQANGGTILLDEISEMDLVLQAKLLRVLQEREVERLGGRKSIPLDIRVIATSNRDMRVEVTEGKFREDLYFRLSVLPLQWAPLRDRKDDIVPIARSLLARHAQKQHRSSVTFTQEAETLLRTYPWPGNVRELDNVMQRALILQAGELIDCDDLGLQIHQEYSRKPSLNDVDRYFPSNTESKGQNASSPGLLDQKLESQFSSDVQPALLEQNKALLVSEFSSDGTNFTDLDKRNGLEDDTQSEEQLSRAPLGKDMRRHEYEIILKTLKQQGGSKKNTAEKLGISPRTLRYKMARLREDGFNVETVSATCGS